MKLKSNRELDRWISVMVFHNEVDNEDGSLIEHNIHGSQPLPNYTSDMNSAVKVLSSINGYLEYQGYEEVLWCASMDYATFYPTYHKNPAMAICLAACKLYTGEDWGN